MSNGTPEPFEGGPQGPLGPTVLLALGYTVLWVLGAFASLFLDLSALLRMKWVLWLSVALLLASLFVLAREMGFLGRSADRRR